MLKSYSKRRKRAIRQKEEEKAADMEIKSLFAASMSLNSTPEELEVKKPFEIAEETPVQEIIEVKGPISFGSDVINNKKETMTFAPPESGVAQAIRLARMKHKIITKEIVPQTSDKGIDGIYKPRITCNPSYKAPIRGIQYSFEPAPYTEKPHSKLPPQDLVSYIQSNQIATYDLRGKVAPIPAAAPQILPNTNKIVSPAPFVQYFNKAKTEENLNQKEEARLAREAKRDAMRNRKAPTK
jgi:hypothetical protein